MEWRAAGPGDAARLADFVTEVSETKLNEHEAANFLNSWQVEITEQGNSIEAAVCVLSPSSAHRRGYAAIWARDQREDAHFRELADRLVRLAGSTPHLRVLQIALPADGALRSQRLRRVGFEPAYPLWTMTHDNVTWPKVAQIPDGLHTRGWSENSLEAFYTAYEKAYGDQRLVEPHSAETWSRLSNGNDFADDLATLVVTPQDQVVGFVLGFHQTDGGIDLGPIGTIPSWRGRGVSTALLASVLNRCRDSKSAPITLTTDGDSPTRAQEIYLRNGFQVSQHLIAYHLHLPGSRPL